MLNFESQDYASTIHQWKKQLQDHLVMTRGAKTCCSEHEKYFKMICSEISFAKIDFDMKGGGQIK